MAAAMHCCHLLLLPLLAGALVAHAAAAAAAAVTALDADALTIVEARREVDLRSQVEQHALALAVEATAPATALLLAMAGGPRAAHAAATQSGAPLRCSWVTADAAGGAVLRVELARPLAAGERADVQVELAFTHTLAPLPADIAQDEAQLVLWKDQHYVLSPHAVLAQTTVVRLPSERVEALAADVLPVHRNGSTLVFGPYGRVAAFTRAPLSVHFENNAPFATFRSALRTVRVAADGRAHVEERLALEHTGARLHGPFSRFDYQRNRGTSGRSSFRSLTAQLPPDAVDVWLRDELGNVSSSHLRPDGVLELETRFPLFGGWRCDLSLGYSLPPPHAPGALSVPLAPPFADVVVDLLELRVVLPAGAADVAFAAPVAVEHTLEAEPGLFGDAPVLVLRLRDVVPRLVPGHLQVTFTVSALASLRQPLALAAVLCGALAVGSAARAAARWAGAKDKAKAL